ncbi:MAG: ACP phosphodiesterase [Gammaproteobacteria bacterium]|nr:ACP phosphodiesterase [Gammaproteobacteria bacterium]
MNYLAHLLLAENTPASLIGQLAGDFVKGPLKGQWNGAVEIGISEHRKLDVYTDQHPAVTRSWRRISPIRRRYARVIVDIAYDYYLSRHWREFADQDQLEFIAHVHRVLKQYHELLPEGLKQVAPRIIESQLLASYGTHRGLAQAFQRISRRLKRQNALGDALSDVIAHDKALESDFLAFFPEVITYIRVQRAERHARDEASLAYKWGRRDL